MFAIATLQDRDIQALFVTYLAQSGTTRKNWSLCNSVQLEDWSDPQFGGVGLGLQTQPIHLPGGQWIVQWLWEESTHPILPQLKVELHDDQTFLMKKPSPFTGPGPGPSLGPGPGPSPPPPPGGWC